MGMAIGQVDEVTLPDFHAAVEGRLRLLLPSLGGVKLDGETSTTLGRVGLWGLSLAVIMAKPVARSWMLRRERAFAETRWAHARSQDASMLGQPARADEPWLDSDSGSEEVVLGKRCRLLTEVGLLPDADGLEVSCWDLPARLLAQRRVVLRKGRARLQLQQDDAALEAVFVQRMEALVCKMMAMAEASLPALRRQPGLHDVLQLFASAVERCAVEEASRSADGAQWDNAAGLSSGNFEKLLRQSFPPCAQRLVDRLRTGRRLRFLGRLQLRPFLREAGFSFRESMAFWERELCHDPNVSSSLFHQKFEYHVHHAYGLKGQGKPAFAFSCPKVAAFPAPRGRAEMVREVHGCPFCSQQLPLDDLRQELPSYGVAADSHHATAILELVKAHLPRQACAAYFRVRHPGTDWRPMEIWHPNEFLRRSRRYYTDQSSSASRKPAACKDGGWQMQPPQDRTGGGSVPRHVASACRAQHPKLIAPFRQQVAAVPVELGATRGRNVVSVCDSEQEWSQRLAMSHAALCGAAAQPGAGASTSSSENLIAQFRSPTAQDASCSSLQSRQDFPNAKESAVDDCQDIWSVREPEANTWRRHLFPSTAEARRVRLRLEQRLS